MNRIHQLTRLERGFWPVAMMLVEMADGLLVYSPTWLGDDTFARVEEHGTPRFLVAPNHFHHLSLRRFRERYPNATAVASPTAQPRLASKGHRNLVEPAAVELPSEVRLVCCPHTKNGEMWVEVHDADACEWLVADAYFHVTRSVAGVLGALLRWTNTAPGLCIGQTFRWLALRDEGAYRRWLLGRLDSEPPDRVSFCHGEPIERDAASALRDVAMRRLRR